MLLRSAFRLPCTALVAASPVACDGGAPPSSGACSAPDACQSGLLCKADLDCQLATMAPDVRTRQKCAGNHRTL